MVCGLAAGVLLPPYIIYCGEHMWDTWVENGPKRYPLCTDICCRFGSSYNRTKHGWIDAPIFVDWFKVIIGDNLSSHFNTDVIQLCEENDIHFVCLPKSSIHLCQPLDVGFFRPLKEVWRNKLTQYKTSHSNCKV